MSAKLKPANNVVSINPKGDAAVADERHAAERSKVLDAIDTAEDLLGSALIAGLRMTVEFGRTSAAEVQAHYTRCNNPAVYASWFNLGDRAQQVVGQKLALEAIAKAEATGSGSFQKAREALAAICSAAKGAGVKELNGRAAQAAVREAVKSATDKAATRKAEKSAVKVIRGTKAQDTTTMAAAALECGKGHREMAAFVKLASQQAQRLPEVQGRESAHREAVAALAKCSELWSVFSK